MGYFALKNFTTRGVGDIFHANGNPRGSFFHLFESIADFAFKAIANFEENFPIKH